MNDPALVQAEECRFQHELVLKNLNSVNHVVSVDGTFPRFTLLSEEFLRTPGTDAAHNRHAVETPFPWKRRLPLVLVLLEKIGTWVGI